MKRSNSALILFSCLGICVPAAAQEDPFAAGVRATEPLTPEQEQKTFTLPPGFEVQLFAADPEIAKPMNMAFDARGRLWVTDTIEYPYAAPPDREPRDSLKILEDTDGDGRADRITTFADKLNIPIGVYPYKNGAIVFSIPNVWFMQDTDGDGVADKRDKLYGPMDYSRDTHGLHNAFHRGYDGWVYSCHGFNNDTHVAGTDGHEIHMNSGNTYRMRTDGSRVEHYTHGQVNPFGMAMDPLGNLFTADCHSKPVTQLLRDGYYPSFGKPHDGLGFVPSMMDHLHGSTAICGLVYYSDEKFPEEFRGNLFSGNVMTSRINRNKVETHGSTMIAVEQPDFLSTTDPWFRPVDLQMATDGSMYVADFYNRIIGHYEVPLTHPGRDRTSGRIWRIAYAGGKEDAKAKGKLQDLSKAKVEDLLTALEAPNVTTNILALNELTDRVGKPVVPVLRKHLKLQPSPRGFANTLWALHRLDGLEDDDLVAGAQHKDPLVRVHTMKILSEMPRWNKFSVSVRFRLNPPVKRTEFDVRSFRDLAIACLSDSDAFVKRAAADALGQHPVFQNVEPLLQALAQVPKDDALLDYTIRRALQKTLSEGDSLAQVSKLKLDDAGRAHVADVCLAVKTPAAGAYLLHLLQSTDVPQEVAAKYLEHAAIQLPAEDVDALVSVSRERFKDDVDFQRTLLTSIHDGLRQRGVTIPASVTAWALDVARALLANTGEPSPSWVNQPIPGMATSANPWALEKRPSADGDKDSRFLSSWPAGETATGVLRSNVFPLPAKLSFYLAGHIGFPEEQPIDARNFVRLRDAETHELLAEVSPPRNDLAQLITWDLGSHEGRSGYLEVVDGDDRGGYAWLAFGRLEPEVVSWPKKSPRGTEQRQRAAADLAANLNLQELASDIARLTEPQSASMQTREAAIRALLTLTPDVKLSALAALVGDPITPDALRDRITEAVRQRDSETLNVLLADVMKSVPQRHQQQIAEALAADKSGADTLIDLVTRGLASARLLQREAVRSRLVALSASEYEPKIAELTANLPTQNEAIDSLIAARRTGLLRAAADVGRGEQVFKKHCAACHQIAGQGAVVGPQLDGIGNRGRERLVEDVLDPNRNVDVAFHTMTIVLDDGTIATGLLRQDQDAVLLLVDNKGKEFTVEKARIDEQVKSKLSLMPDNVSELVPEQEFYDLMTYLLAQRGKPAEPAAGE